MEQDNGLIHPSYAMISRIHELRAAFITPRVCAAVLIGTVLIKAQTPEISYLELPTNSPNSVYIHFYTDPGHTYYLQYNNLLLCTNCSKELAATNWSNMFTGFNYPFSEHYVIVDSRTNKSRFYRLRMTTP